MPGKTFRTISAGLGTFLLLVLIIYTFYKMSKKEKEEAAEAEKSAEQRLKDSQHDLADIEEQENRTEKSATELWRKAKVVKITAGMKLHAELRAAAEQLGLDQIKDAKEDVQGVVSVMKRGGSRTQTKLKISIGLAQILGELPAVLEIKYPPGFTNFIDSLGFVKLDLFKIIKIDCMVKQSIYSRFVATMLAPLVLIGILQLWRVHKSRKLYQAQDLMSRSEIITQKAKLNATASGRCFAAVLSLSAMSPVIWMCVFSKGLK